MGYIEQNLMEGEQIIMRAQLHYIVYWKPAVLILLALILFVFQISPEVYSYQGILAAILLVIAFISILVIHGNRKYILTNRRLIEKVGIVRRESREILLRKCEGVQLSQSIMGRLLNYGTVVVSTTGEAENDYKYIQAPVRFQTLINQQIDHLRDDS
ncbi:MAG: PH domain-containing protein [Prevotella sp.]|nr:PH domain-containing protein [Prevotella sp.]